MTRTHALLALILSCQNTAGFTVRHFTHHAVSAPPRHSPSITRRFMSEEKDDSSSSTAVQDEVRANAEDALSNVGWSMPSPQSEEALTADDPFVQAIDEGIQRDIGVSLDELLNPAKVVNLERDLYNLRMELASATGKSVDGSTESEDGFLTTQDCDGGGGGEEAENIRKTIAKKEASLVLERRTVFRGWLKTVFLVQAVLSFGISYVMANNPESLFGGFSWYNYYNMDISISVLGYWWWWLFVIPSLRSRRPKGDEKKALDIAFIASPVVSLIAPAFTRDTGIIWDVNLVVVLASYAYGYLASGDDDSDGDDANQPAWLKFVFKSLDFGSGRERGARN